MKNIQGTRYAIMTSVPSTMKQTINNEIAGLRDFGWGELKKKSRESIRHKQKLKPWTSLFNVSKINIGFVWGNDVAHASRV